tara:strand:+ start:575 stop:766 length:192 start_codon:yes stop_codon:yes gene_type:complete
MKKYNNIPGTVEEIEYAGGWVDGLCNGYSDDCPHLFICLCEEERYYKKKQLELTQKNNRKKNE